MDKQKKIIDFCKNELNLDTIGFIKCRKFEELRDFYLFRKNSNSENEFEEKDIEKRIEPSIYMEDARAIISIAFPYNTFENTLDNGFSIYTKGEDYHKVVFKYLNSIIKYIESLGGKALGFVDSNSLPERYIAYLAGVGIIGKNNMIITKKYGSFVFLSEIITDLDIGNLDKGTFSDIKLYKDCKDCDICLKECPTKSINNFKRNPNICLSYLTQKKDLKDSEMNLLKGRIFGCDSCQNKCPKNKNISKTPISEFKIKDFMKNSLDDYIININNSEFKESFKNTSCGWRGKNTLIRNALIRKKYKGEDIESFKSESPYLKGYKDRLL